MRITNRNVPIMQIIIRTSIIIGLMNIHGAGQ
jgi:hypothetical protein